MCHCVLVITLFEQVPHNNSLKLLLWHFLWYFGTVSSHYVYQRVYLNIIRLIKAHSGFFETACIESDFSFLFLNFRQSGRKHSGNFQGFV